MSEGTIYNTNQQTGEILKASKTRAGTQEYQVLLYFLYNKKPRPPSRVHLMLNFGRRAKGLREWPLTSIRRAINTLTDKKHLLEKTDNLKIGPYGENEHIWKLKGD